MSKKKKLVILGFLVFIILLIFFIIYILINKVSYMTIDLSKLNETFIQEGAFNLNNMEDIDIEYLKNEIGIDDNIIQEYIGKKPQVAISASMYLVIKVNNKEDASKVYNILEQYIENYKNTWGNYLLSEYNLITEGKLGKKNNYVYLIICENAKQLESKIY